ncbi:MAG: transporter [Flavobacteriaceae bacterium]|nr:MAG: transporter [Flavobacteriaceae bacterium]
MKFLYPYRTLLVVLIILVPGIHSAQDVQPRVYAPVPTGVNLLTLGYAYSGGAVLFDKTIPIDNVRADIHSFTAAYSRSTGLFGKAGRFDVAVPLVAGNWDGAVLGELDSTSRFGIGDPVLRYAAFIIGAPALSKEEFAGFQPKTIVGLTMRVQVPLGQYDANKLINLGSNRWVFSPQIGVWHVIGKFTLEAYSGVWFFTDNQRFLGTQVRSQEPLFTFQIHASYTFDNGIWIAASSRQSLGGAVTVDNGDRLDPETNNRLGLSLSVPVGSKYTIKVVGTTGTTATVGNNYDTLALAWQVVF